MRKLSYKILLYILFLFLSKINSIAQTNNKIDTFSLISTFLRSPFKLYTDTINICRAYKDFYLKMNGESFRIANPNEPYNCTDSKVDFLPNHQLVYTGFNKKNNIGFIYYYVGVDIYPSLILEIFEINKSKSISNFVHLVLSELKVFSLYNLKRKVKQKMYLDVSNKPTEIR